MIGKYVVNKTEKCRDFLFFDADHNWSCISTHTRISYVGEDGQVRHTTMFPYRGKMVTTELLPIDELQQVRCIDRQTPAECAEVEREFEANVRRRKLTLLIDEEAH